MVFEMIFNRLNIGKNDPMGYFCYAPFAEFCMASPIFYFIFRWPITIYYIKCENKYNIFGQGYYAPTSLRPYAFFSECVQ